MQFVLQSQYLHHPLASFNKFKGYIENYEKYIIDSMEANTFSVVSSWALLIASFAVIVKKDLWKGPKGWVNAMAAAVSGVSLLATFTSTIYATTARAEYSKKAQQYLVNAQNQMNLKTGLIILLR